jgi:hypothetical protein
MQDLPGFPRLEQPEVRAVPKSANVTAQNAGAHPMKGADGNRRAIAQECTHAPLHFSSRSIGECYGQNAPGLDLAFEDSVRKAACNDTRFSAPGTRRHQQRRAIVDHGVQLFGVQVVKLHGCDRVHSKWRKAMRRKDPSF